MKKAAKAPTKKAKAAAGGTALLGLVTLLCLTGNIPSWPNSATVPAHLDSQVNDCPCNTTCATCLPARACHTAQWQYLALNAHVVGTSCADPSVAA